MLEQRRFLRATGAELTIMVTIVGVTAFLVNAPPARTAAEMHGPAAMDGPGTVRSTICRMPLRWLPSPDEV